MTAWLYGYKVAILLATGFEQSEMAGPKRALEDAGASVYIVAPGERVQGWDWFALQPKDEFVVDVPLNRADSNDYDALLIPGGYGADDLRLEEKAVTFVKGFDHKPIAAICHGQWLLIESELAKNKTLTSWPSIKKDLKNAGANWVDKEVVRDGNLVTSRKPEDVPAFNQAMIQLFSEALAQKKI